MGLLNRWLKQHEEKDSLVPWKILQEEDLLDEIIKDSHQKPVVLFKHSIRCGISSMAKDRLERKWDFTAEELDIYYLDLINYRSISNRIADLFGVVHQSPQVIVLRNGKAVFDASHNLVSVENLRNSIEENP
jgi:bacillithiol system protein YtxJ